MGWSIASSCGAVASEKSTWQYGVQWLPPLWNLKKHLAGKRFATETLTFIACMQRDPCARHKGVWRVQVYLSSCLTSVLDELVVSFTFRPLYPRRKRPTYPLNMRLDVLQSGSERSEGAINFLWRRGIKTKFGERPARSLVISLQIWIMNRC